jgi:hypothetical protein
VASFGFTPLTVDQTEGNIIMFYIPFLQKQLYDKGSHYTNLKTHYTITLYKIEMKPKVIYNLYWLKAMGVLFNCQDRGAS